MTMTLGEWNGAERDRAREKLLSCCGSGRWVEALVEQRPYASVEGLIVDAEAFWFELPEAEWLRAFACHPRIGEWKAEVGTTAQFADWSGTEQRSAQATLEAVGAALVEGNRAYEAKFGFLYIVFASGKTAPELLAILEERLGHDRETELNEAARQQWAITRLRLEKLFKTEGA
jgi:2-oxo-4-hydroxy-4-carboxy-5-ureidoimidazoline decarboxylase